MYKHFSTILICTKILVQLFFCFLEKGASVQVVCVWLSRFLFRFFFVIGMREYGCFRDFFLVHVFFQMVCGDKSATF